MKFAAKLEKLNSSVYGHCVTVPESIANQLIEKNGRRVTCTLNKTVTYQCALMPMGEGMYFINVTKELHKKLDVKIGSILQVELQPDTSEYGLPMPEELQVLLQQDEKGNEVFHSLTLGKQRNLLYIIGKPKSSDIRLKKAIIIIDYLKATNGKLDFKALNIALKG